MQGVLTPTACRPAYGKAVPVRPRRLTGQWGRHYIAHSAANRVQAVGGRKHKGQCFSRCSRRHCVTAAQTQEEPQAEIHLPEEFKLGEQDDTVNKFTKRMGLGTWRVKGAMKPAFAGLTAQVEGLWRHMLEDLKLYQLDQKYKFIDSMDPERKAGPYGYAEIPSPEKGEPSWPRMQIENRCYKNSVFRKLHLELAHRQDGLQVLHCVMYPRVEYDLPILSFDMVGKNEQVSLVCIDPCPVSHDRRLPPIFVSLVSELQERYNLQNNRSVPEWGKEIFSPLCVIMRPSKPEELANFIKYTIALSQAYLQLSMQTNKIPSKQSSRLTEVKEAHKRYAQQHLKNSSTRAVLTAAFTAEVADAYMQNVMFDGLLPEGASDVDDVIPQFHAAETFRSG